MTHRLKLAVFILLVSAIPAAWPGSCEQLDCNCNGIPNKPLQKKCISHESILKASCSSPADNVRGYCGLHGPEGYPVAVTLSRESVDASTDVKGSDRQIAQLYWSIRQDQAYAKKRFCCWRLQIRRCCAEYLWAECRESF